jgi:glycosyltransferase involved in cell wall biosynthesis
MKILALPRFGPAGASSRLRLLQFLGEWNAHGMRTCTQTLIGDDLLRVKYAAGRYPILRLLAAYAARTGHVAWSTDADLLWIEKEALPWLPASLEKMVLGHRPYVLDFDDAVFHNYDRHRLPIVRRLFGRRVDELMAGARLVVAGNEYLAQRARNAGAPWVEIAPTVVDLQRYPIGCGTTAPTEPPRIVWIGSPSTAQYLGLVAAPLAQLAKQHRFVFRVIGATPPPLPGVQVEALPWSADTEAQRIGECDFGVMPLFDTPWEQGKCAYKLIQYMACGLPTVASAVGANNDVTIEGGTGFLVQSDSQWVQRLQQLLEDAALRRRLGAAGRRRVEQRYSLQVMAPKMKAWLEQAAGAASCAA